ncbi:MAG: prepilin peptidase [Spirochaetes bacterium]|nr:prepilin peptidase [Spirochaetota bacterium]
MMIFLLPVSAWCFFLAAVLVSFVDIRTLRIPFLFWLLPLLAGFAELLIRSGGLAGWEPLLVVLRRVLEAGLMLGLLLLFRLAVRRKFGLGDVWFLSALTLPLGLIGVFMVLFVASLAGILVGLLLKMQNKPIPFAPFIAAGILFTIPLYGFIVEFLGFGRL